MERTTTKIIIKNFCTSFKFKELIIGHQPMTLIKSVNSSFQRRQKANALLIILFFFIQIISNAQTAVTIPPLYNLNAGGADNAFPLNSATSNQVQWVFAPGAFNTNGTTGTPAGSGSITKIYFLLGGTTNNATVYSNFTLKLAQNVGTITAWPSIAFNPGMTTVFSAPSFTITGAAAGAWIMVPLTTPFRYDPTLSLVFEMSVTAGTGNQTRQTTITGNSRVFGPSGGAATGSATGMLNFGIEVVNLAPNDAGVIGFDEPTAPTVGSNTIIARVKNFGNNIINTVDVNWSVDGVLQTPVTYNTAPIDTVNGTGSTTAAVTLGTSPFTANTLHRFKAWTSMPNSVADTVLSNDTNARIFRTPALSGSFTVGTTGDFVSITEAISVLNDIGVNGPTTFQLIDTLYNAAKGEVFPLTFSNVTGNSAVNTITFKPAFGNNAVIVSNTGNIINFSGSRNIILDGRDSSNNNNRNLSIINTSLTGTLVALQNDAISNTIRNINLRSANTSTTAGSINILASTGFIGNDSNRIVNNYFGRSTAGNYAIGILSQGTSAIVQNNTNTISGNEFNSFSFNGILVNGTNTGNGSFWNISNNSFYDTATTTVQTTTWNAINFIPGTTSGSVSNTINNNFIGGSAANTGGLAFNNNSAITRVALQVTTALGGANTIYGNVIRNWYLPNTINTLSFTGIQLSGGVANIDSNTVDSFLSFNNAALIGINATPTANYSITRNQIKTLSVYNVLTTAAIRGITLSGGQVVNVSNNTIKGFRTNANNTGTTTAASIVGIGSSASSNTVTIANNNIGTPSEPLRNNHNSVSSCLLVGIVATAGTNTIENNTIDGIHLDSLATTSVGTTSSAAINGILNSSSLPGQIIRNNIVKHLYQRSAQAAQTTQINGICYVSSGFTTITNNTVYGLFTRSTNTNTSTSCALNGINFGSSGQALITNNYIDSLAISPVTPTTTQVNGIIVSGTSGNRVANNTIKTLYNAFTTTNPGIIGIQYVASALNNECEGNTISGLVNTHTSTTGAVQGIRYLSSTTLLGNNSFCNNNFVHSFSSRSTTATVLTGIEVVANSFASFSNNLIRLGIDTTGNPFTGPFTINGINNTVSTATFTNRFYHNTVYIGGTPLTGTSATAAFRSSFGSLAAQDIRNNIFVNLVQNTGGTGSNYAINIGSAPVTVQSIINYNILWAGTGLTNNFIGGGPGNATSMLGTAGWRRLAGIDLNSVQANPGLIAPNVASGSINLRPATNNVGEGVGDNALTLAINTDFGNNNRITNTPVDIGAWSSATNTLSADSIAPLISYTSLTNTPSIVNRTFTATIVEVGSGIEAGTFSPKVYFNKNNGTFFSTSGALASGNYRNGNWTFTIDYSLLGGVIPTDVIRYYVIAQDSTGNYASLPAYAVAANTNTVTNAPATPNQYIISNPIPLTVTVGATGNYTSLTGASGLFNAINNSLLQGNTTVLLQGGTTITELGSVGLNQWLEINAGVIGNFGYTLTIRPLNNTQVLMTGAVTTADGMIRLNGADRVRFEGFSTTGTPTDTNLLIRNTATSQPVLTMLNDASDNTITNVIFETNNTSTGVINGGAVRISSTSLITGNDNIEIRNCHFRRFASGLIPTILFAASGTTGVNRENENLLIENSYFYGFNTSAISIGSGTGNNYRIKNNVFFQDTASIHTTSPLVINFIPGNLSNNDTISGNLIAGNNFGGTGEWFGPAATSFTFIGINVTAGAITGTFIDNNRIANINFTNTATNNFTGIIVNNGGGVATITNNYIGDTLLTDNIKHAGNGSTLAISCQTGSNSIINNNIIANITNTSNIAANTTVVVNGIRAWNQTAILQINNNRIINLRDSSLNVGSNTAAPVMGINISSGTTSIQVNNNFISGLTNLSRTVSTSSQVLGIFNATGLPSITNNVVENLNSFSTNTGTTTTATLIGIWSSSSSPGQTISNNTVRYLTYNNPAPTNAQVIGIMQSSGSGHTINNNLVHNIQSNSVSTGTTVSSAIIGIMHNGSGSALNINGNTVHTLEGQGLSGTINLVGILYQGTTAVVTNFVTRNYIHSFKLATTSVGRMIGIQQNSGSFTRYANNMVRLGIDSSGALYTGPYEVYGFLNDVTGNFEYFHNSVYLGGAPATGASITAAIRLSGTLTGTQLYDIRNNILVNNIANNGGSGKNFAIRLAALPVNPSNLVSNFNLLRANGTGRHIAGTNTIDYTTLTGIVGWLRGSGYDLQSGTTNDSLFLNSTGPAFDVNLRLEANNPAEGAGDPSLAAIVTTDFDGNLRATLTPFDIGANAGAFTLSADVFPPSISYTPATNQGDLTGPLTISNVNIKDNVGVPLINGVSMPRIYFKKGVAGTYASTMAIAYTGNERNANFTFEIQYGILGGVNTADTIFYYIIAEDSLGGNICSQKPYAIASNVNTVTNEPLNPDFYIFLPVIPANSLFEVGAGQTYTTLTGTGGLFEMLNGNTIGGSITAVIKTNTTEPGTFALNQIGEDGAGAGTYTLTIRPDSTATTARIISGNIGTGILKLNGADRVKITGVPHQSSNTALNYLTLRNSNSSGPVVLFVNGATQCRLNNLTIETANNLGVALNAGGVSFAGTTNSFGNSMDSITNCTIRNDQSQTFPNGIPAILIGSFHSGLVLNSNNVISNCNLLNASSVYVNVDAGSGNAWNVSGNSCYINLPVITANPLPIRFNGGILSEGHTINNNIIGGTAANGGGAAWTSNVQAAWNQIQLNVGNNIASTVNGNKIVNINFAQSASGTQWNGIIVSAGRTNITNNMIGDSTNLTSIQLSPPTNHNAIAITSTVNVPTTISGNRIVGFFLNSPGNTVAFNGITVAGGITTITNNIIGAATIANSIVCNGSSTVRGINITTPVNIDPGIIISNNTIANMSASGTQNTVSIGGILQAGSTVSVITGNRVYNLSALSSNTSLSSAPAAFGISLAAATNLGPVIANNTVYNIAANNNSAVLTHAMGIIIQSANGARVNNNRVYDIRNLSTATSINPMATASGVIVFGITNAIDILNNQITLGNAQTNNIQYNGIWQNTSGGFNINCYYNSVLITGNNAAGNLNSYAFHRGANSVSEITSGITLINNALLNNRTGGTAKNYAIANEISGIPTGSGWLNVNYNMLASAAANTIGLWGATDMNMSSWRLNSLRDANSWADLSASVNASALFTDVANGNLNIVTTAPQNWYLNGKGIAGSVSGSINDDYAGNTRGTTPGIGTDIGATEFTSSATPPAVTVSGTPALNGSSTISFANRNLATINWGSTGTVPTSITGAYYSGTNPPATLPGTRFLNAYLALSATGGSAYSYTSTINYDPALLGTVVSESVLRGATYNGSFWSGYPSSTVNTTAKTISIPTITNSVGVFTGTDANAALPVQLIQFTANPVAKDVWLNWVTASELNNKGFVVERSVNGKDFEYVNFVKGKGNSANTHKYSFSDPLALEKASTLYYRLKQVDFDGAFTYSNIVKVSIFNTEPFAIKVFPNPFTENFQLELVTPENGIAEVSISDITGKEVYKTTLNPLAGKNIFAMDNISALHGGIYFIKVSQGNNQSISKIVQLK
ncbi:MAG: T9SS type A sorting domain-containing protein [Bacteroidota bacterium]